MLTYDYADVQKDIETIFNESITDDVIITRNDGYIFKIISMKKEQPAASPLDIPGIDTNITMDDIVESVRECREREDFIPKTIT